MQQKVPPWGRAFLRRLKNCCKLQSGGKNLAALPNCGACESQRSAQQDIQKGALEVLLPWQYPTTGPEASSNRREIRSGFKSSQPPLAGKVTEVTQISKDNLRRPLSSTNMRPDCVLNTSFYPQLRAPPSPHQWTLFSQQTETVTESHSLSKCREELTGVADSSGNIYNTSPTLKARGRKDCKRQRAGTFATRLSLLNSAGKWS